MTFPKIALSMYIKRSFINAVLFQKPFVMFYYFAYIFFPHFQASNNSNAKVQENIEINKFF